MRRPGSRWWVLGGIVLLLCLPSGTGSVHMAVGRSGGTATTHGPGASPGSPGPIVLPQGEWPTYMQDPERTGDNSLERTLSVASVAALQELWSVPSNGSDFSAPIVVNGTVYYGSWNGDEYAVNETSGAVEWTTYLGVVTNGCGYTPMGISSTPAYQGGTLYLGGGDGYWYALNATTGAVEWRILAGSESENYYNWASGLVWKESLYIGTSSCFDNPLVAAGLLEVSLTTHAVVAEFNTTPPGEIGESIWTTPALDPRNDTVWVATGNENPPGYPEYANAIIGLNASTLKPLGSWQVPNVAGQDSDFGSTPVLCWTSGGVPLVVATNKNGVAYALNRSNVSVNGTWYPVWSLATGGGFSGGAFDGSTLYLAGGSTVYAVDPGNGSVAWTAGMAGGGTIYGSLTVANGVVYAGGGSEVEAIDASNGTVLWSAALSGGDSTVTEPVVVNGRVFVASGDYGAYGNLTAFGLPSASPYSLNVTERGLPAGTPWSVQVNGVDHAPTASFSLFYVTNGSYDFSVEATDGYRPTPSSGTVLVAGKNLTELVVFSKSAAATFLGLPEAEGLAVLAGVLLVAVIAGVAWARRRFRGSAPSPAPPRGAAAPPPPPRGPAGRSP